MKMLRKKLYDNERLFLFGVSRIVYFFSLRGFWFGAFVRFIRGVFKIYTIFKFLVVDILVYEVCRGVRFK